jgi:hypothetical protein
MAKKFGLILIILLVMIAGCTDSEPKDRAPMPHFGGCGD